MKRRKKQSIRTDITVRDICEGFVYSELEGKGLFGLSGTLKTQILPVVLNFVYILQNDLCGSMMFLFKPKCKTQRN